MLKLGPMFIFLLLEGLAICLAWSLAEANDLHTCFWRIKKWMSFLSKEQVRKSPQFFVEERGWGRGVGWEQMIPISARELTLSDVGFWNFPLIQKHLLSTYCVLVTGIGALKIYLFIYLFIYRQGGREGEREGEKCQCVVASCTTPTGDLACNSAMCPEWELNCWPFGSQASAQSTEQHQPGLQRL